MALKLGGARSRRHRGGPMKICMIGGGSVQWTPVLVADIARTPELAGASFVLYDIDATALDLLRRAAERTVRELGADIIIEATNDRRAALRDADYVILCVSIGGLAAMRNDLEIPREFGIAQSVGDTVGPGGLARALRHIPFAVEIAREMEELCPQAWLLNLTNPMTVICRAITRATSIRAIGLCHEVGNLQHELADIFGVPTEQITLSVAGINHLPVILGFTIAGNDGMPVLQQWLAEHGVNAMIERHADDPVRDVFTDRLAVKFSLLQQFGVLFGAGDRHVAEFFANMLSEQNDFGGRYGVKLTTIEQREQLAAQRREHIQRYVDGLEPVPPRSSEQLALIIAALAGRKAGRFVVNIPNQGQIASLPLNATVECIADVDALGLRPHSTGALPQAAQAVIAGHVARQELIVEAALTNKRAAALAALSSDPLLRDLADAAPLLDRLLEANRAFGGTL